MQAIDVFGYVRVSTEEQRANTSIPRQADVINRFCEKEGFSLKAIFADAESGSVFESREGIVSAVEAMFEGQAHGLVCFSFDRLSRNVEDRAVIRRRCKENGKLLVSATEQIDIQSPSGKLYYSVRSALDELERETILARVWDGRCRKVFDRRGWPSGKVPYGYSVKQGELGAGETASRFMMGRKQFDAEFGLTFSCEVWESIEQAIRIRLLIAGMCKPRRM